MQGFIRDKYIKGREIEREFGFGSNKDHFKEDPEVADLFDVEAIAIRYPLSLSAPVTPSPHFPWPCERGRNITGISSDEPSTLIHLGQRRLLYSPLARIFWVRDSVVKGDLL